MKKSFLVLMGLIFSFSLTFFVGCGDIYKNMKIELSENKIEIEIQDNKEVEPVKVIASVVKVDSDVSRELKVSTQSNCVSVSSTLLNDKTTEILITPISTIPENTAEILIKSVEGDKTATINVKVIKKATEMFYNEDYKPAVALNSQLQLNGALAVKYGEKDFNATEKDVTFSLKNAYEGIELSETGLLTVHNVKPQNEQGKGEILVEAVNKSNPALKATIPVRVIEPITSEEKITFILDDEEVENYYIKINQNAQPILTLTVKDNADDYAFIVESLDEKIVNVESDSIKNNEFMLYGIKAQATKLRITCYVVGYKDFYSFTFEKDINVVFVPEQIWVNGKTEQNQELALFSEYKNGSFGTKVKFDISPNGISEEVSTLVLSCEQSFDGVENIDNATELFKKIKWLNPDEDEVKSLDELPNGISLYASFNGDGDILELDGLIIKISSASFKDIYNTIKIKVYNSISKISVEGEQEVTDKDGEKVNRILIEKGKTRKIDVSVFNAQDVKLDISSTDLDASVKNTGEKQVASVSKQDNNFIVSALETGEAVLRFYSMNGIEKSVRLKVFNALEDNVSLSLPSPSINSSVAMLKLEETEENYRETYTFKVFVSNEESNISIQFIYNPDATVIKNFGYSDRVYYEISDTGELRANKVTEEEKIVELTLIGWKRNIEDDTYEEKVYKFKIKLSVVEGLGELALKFEQPYKNTIYAKSTVGAFYQNDVKEDENDENIKEASLCKTVISINVSNNLLDNLQDDDITYNWIVLNANNTVNNITKYNSETNEWLYEMNSNTYKYDFENSVWLKYVMETDEWVEVDNEPSLINGIETPTWLSLKLSVKTTVRFNVETTTLKLIIEAPEILPNDAKEMSYYAKFIAHQYDVEVPFQKQFKLVKATTVENITVTNMNVYNGKIQNSKKAYNVYFDIRNGINTTDIAITPKYTVSPTNVRNTRVRFYAKDLDFNFIDVTSIDSPIYLNETTGNFYPKRVGLYYIYIISEDNIIELDDQNKFPLSFRNASVIVVEVGNGSKEYPFHIKNFNELKDINNYFTYVDDEKKLTYHYKLVDDINGNFEEFTPIGIVDGEDIGFSASIDGNGYEIINLYITSNNNNVGFVSKLNAGASLEKIKLRNIVVNTLGTSNVGLLVGENNGEINGSYSNWQNIPSSTNAENSETETIDTTNTENNETVNFVTNFNYSNFDIQGAISALYAENVGGLVGLNNGTIKEINVKTVSITINTNQAITFSSIEGKTNVGGLVGLNNNNISTCLVNCIVTGETNVGGFVGYNNGNIERAQVELYEEDEIITLTGDGYVGGIVGINEGTITLSYARDFYQNTKNMLVNMLIGTCKGVICGYNKDKNEGNAIISYTYAMCANDFSENLCGKRDNALLSDFVHVYAKNGSVGGQFYTAKFNNNFEQTDIPADDEFYYDEEHTKPIYQNGELIYNPVEKIPTQISARLKAEINNGCNYELKENINENNSEETLENNEENLNNNENTENNNKDIFDYETITNFFEVANGQFYVLYLKNKISENTENNTTEKINLTNEYELKYIFYVLSIPAGLNLDIVVSSDNTAVVKIVGKKLVIVNEGTAYITLKHIKNQFAVATIKVQVVKGVNDVEYSTSVAEIKNNEINVNISSVFNIEAISKYIVGNYVYEANNLKYNVSYDADYIEVVDLDKLIFKVNDLETSKDEPTVITLTPYFNVDYETEQGNLQFKRSMYQLQLKVNCLKRATDFTVSQTTQELFPIDQTSATVTMLSLADSGEDILFDISYISSDLLTLKKEEQTTEESSTQESESEENGTETEDNEEGENSTEIITPKDKKHVLQYNNKDAIIIMETPLTNGGSSKVDGFTVYSKYNTYTIYVCDDYKPLIDEDLVITFRFYSSKWNIQKEDYPYIEYTLTIIPQQLINVGIEHYPIGTGPYRISNNGGNDFIEPEVSTNIITKGTEGILQLNLHPIYAKIEYIKIISSSAGGDKITFKQVEYEKQTTQNDEEYYIINKNAYINPDYDDNGAMFIHVDNTSTNGLYYLQTYLASNIAEDTLFTINVIAKGKNNTEEIIATYQIIAKDVPHTELELDKTQVGFVNSVSDVNYVVNGLTQIVNLVQKGFDSDNITYQIVNKKDNKIIDNAQNYLTLVSKSVANSNTYYSYLLDTSSLAVGSDYEIRFFTTATTYGISTTKSSQSTIRIVDCYYTNLSFAEMESLVKVGNADINYGGYNTFIVSGQKIDSTGVKDVNSLTDEKLAGLIKNISDNRNEFIGIETNSISLSSESKDDGNFIKVNGIITQPSKIILSCKIIYNDSGELEFVSKNEQNSIIDCGTINLSVTVSIGADYDNPIPIYNYDEFVALKNITDDTNDDEKHFILMADIYLQEDYKPMNLNILSLDGNNYTIYVNKFNLRDYNESTSVNIALFNTISKNALLKNVRVDYSQAASNLGIESTTNGDGDLTKFTNVNFALFAVTNNGILNNCSVEFSTNKMYSFTVANDNYDTSNFSLFVNTNLGNITNSSVNKKLDITEMENKKSLVTLKANGQLAGFVNENRGVISQCSTKQFTLENTSHYSDGTVTAGFVGINYNRARISSSYVNGFGNFVDYSLNGEALISNGAGAGFVFKNRGGIDNCYANISIQGIKAQAGGFIYQNYESGEVLDSVCASLITPLSTSSSLFCAKDNLKQSLNSGTFSYCYVYQPDGSTSITEITDNDDGVIISNLPNMASEEFNGINLDYYHFYIDVVNAQNTSNISNSNWTLTKKGPFISIANRKITRKRNINTDPQYNPAINSEAKTYSYIDIDLKYGESQVNPVIVDSVETFSKFLSSLEKSGTINLTNKYIMFVNDIDFDNSNILSDKTSRRVFSGEIEGHGFALKNISIINNDPEYSIIESLGLFSKIVKRDNNYNSIIRNLELNIDEITATRVNYVGALAGQIENTTVFNLNITGVSTTSAITGRNMVGGIVGVQTNSQITNSSLNAVSVIAEYSQNGAIDEIDSAKEYIYSYSPLYSLDSYSYAGGIAGFVRGTNKDCFISKVTVQGNTQIRGENAGGVVGYLGHNTCLVDAKFIAQYNQSPIIYSQAISGLRSAGGVVAHLDGTAMFVSLDFVSSVQSASDALAKNYGSSVGLENLFSKTNYRMGGLVGYLTGGELSYSYSVVQVNNAKSFIAGGVVGEAKAGNINNVYTTSHVSALRVVNEILKPYCAGFIGVISPEANIDNIVDKNTCFACNSWRSFGTNIRFNYFAFNVDNIANYKVVKNLNDYAVICEEIKANFNAENHFTNADFPRINLYIG